MRTYSNNSLLVNPEGLIFPEYVIHMFGRQCSGTPVSECVRQFSSNIQGVHNSWEYSMPFLGIKHALIYLAMFCLADRVRHLLCWQCALPSLQFSATAVSNSGSLVHRMNR